MKAVIKLCESYYYTKRCITADNFFTSIALCQHLWEKGLQYIGTIRSNKLEIPMSFLRNKLRKEGSSTFGFKNFLTIVSFVPKKKKSVILVSTSHHDSTINDSTNKPDIIMDYNKFKGKFYFKKLFQYYLKYLRRC